MSAAPILSPVDLAALSLPAGPAWRRRRALRRLAGSCVALVEPVNMIGLGSFLLTGFAAALCAQEVELAGRSVALSGIEATS